MICSSVKQHRGRTGRIAVILLVSCTVAPACVPQSRPAPAGAGGFWPAYLGNSARSPFLNERVTADTPRIAWSAGVGSGIRGMPVATDEVVVAGTTDEQLFVLNRQDGSEFWRHGLDGPPVSPLISGDRIYTVTERDGKLKVLRIREGQELSELDLPSVRVPAALVEDILYVATERGLLLSIDADTRREIWRATFPTSPVAGPLIVEDWIVYFGTDSLRIVSRGSGRPLRSAPLPGRPAGEAASDGSHIYITTETGSILAWRLPTLEPAWGTSGFEPFRSGPVLERDTGYAVTRVGQLIRFDLSDGAARILTRVDGTVLAAPVLVANGILVGTLQGTLHLIERNGTVLWKVQLEGSIESPVYVHAGRILVPLYGPVDGPLGSEPLRGKVTELR